MPDHLDVIIVDIEAVLCMPPYALILLLIVWNRRKSQETTFHNHYYTLVISQGIADFAAIFIFFPVTCARAFKVGNRFIYSLGDYGAARFLATGAAYLLITRGIGVALITIQRFITLCKSHSWVERVSFTTYMFENIFGTKKESPNKAQYSKALRLLGYGCFMVT
uniref:Uncharacterized protein n=1 Tax=Caenorhabditis japonica TaxID=281687 RepID=A0A8R1I8N1_CAEJA